MIIWMALRKIFAKHFLYHMAIPLIGGALTELYVVPYLGLTPPIGLTDLFTAKHLVPVVGVVTSYLVVMFFIVTKEVSVPFETANFRRVEQALRDATSYFALCDIPMREWFEPGAFKYYSLLQSKKEADPHRFRYERVIVFKREADRRYAEETVLDRYHADALATSHRKFQIPMGWLPPTEFREILNRVPKEHRLLFRRIPAVLRVLPPWIMRRLPLPAQLDFAVIERPSGKAVIIVPFKKSPTVVLQGDDATPYVAFADAIRAKVYQEDGTIRLDHDFARASVPGQTRAAAYRLQWPMAMGSVPPLLGFSSTGPTGRGPVGLQGDPQRVSVGAPLSLAVSNDDSVREKEPVPIKPRAGEKAAIIVSWYKHSGPGDVVFTPPRTPIAELQGTTTTFAVFKQPGEYLIRVRADNFGCLDTSPGTQCCRTNG
jgi:hypothetical protein